MNDEKIKSNSMVLSSAPTGGGPFAIFNLQDHLIALRFCKHSFFI